MTVFRLKDDVYVESTATHGIGDKNNRHVAIDGSGYIYVLSTWVESISGDVKLLLFRSQAPNDVSLWDSCMLIGTPCTQYPTAVLDGTIAPIDQNCEIAYESSKLYIVTGPTTAVPAVPGHPTNRFARCSTLSQWNNATGWNNYLDLNTIGANDFGKVTMAVYLGDVYFVCEMTWPVLSIPNLRLMTWTDGGGMVEGQLITPAENLSAPCAIIELNPISLHGVVGSLVWYDPSTSKVAYTFCGDLANWNLTVGWTTNHAAPANWAYIDTDIAGFKSRSPCIIATNDAYYVAGDKTGFTNQHIARLPYTSFPYLWADETASRPSVASGWIPTGCRLGAVTDDSPLFAGMVSHIIYTLQRQGGSWQLSTLGVPSGGYPYLMPILPRHLATPPLYIGLIGGAAGTPSPSGNVSPIKMMTTGSDFILFDSSGLFIPIYSTEPEEQSFRTRVAEHDIPFRTKNVFQYLGRANRTWSYGGFIYPEEGSDAIKAQAQTWYHDGNGINSTVPILYLMNSEFPDGIEVFISSLRFKQLPGYSIGTYEWGIELTEV